MKTKFFICEHCGNEVVMIHHSGVTPVCCGDPMKELIPNTKEAAYEKHIPFVVQNGNEVSVAVGSVLHPMVEAHFIKWIYIETTKGGQFKKLAPNQEPKANFTLADEKLVAVYEYCNLHGLWVYEAK
ncbi:MAG: desulfoferrodoxin family protein [Bacilli bacterium]